MTVEFEGYLLVVLFPNFFQRRNGVACEVIIRTIRLSIEIVLKDVVDHIMALLSASVDEG